MTLKEYIDGINKFAKENPETLEMQVVASKDAEGNGFNIVHYTPSKGFYENREFTCADQYDDWGYEENDTNAVCIN